MELNMTLTDTPMYVRADDVEFLEDFLSELADQLQLDADRKLPVPREENDRDRRLEPG
jgi:hypothetical protein